jgi:hypothetical protein
MEIVCPHRTMMAKHPEQPVCRIVAELADLPLADCHVTDSACESCLTCGIAPQAPNPATASMAIGAAERTGDTAFLRQVMGRMRPHLRKVPPPTTDCILRGKSTRKVECKPCNAGAGGLMVDVFACPIHSQCTLMATGISPRIQSCAGCQDRLEKAYQLEAKPVPPQVLAQVHAKQRR